jgi:AcrR family transcriptional regulator
MIDQSTLNGRVIGAAMKLAAEKPWKDVTLLEIAEAAGTNLASVKGVFASKPEILAAFARAVDDELLRRMPGKALETSPRDRLFEIVMTRFDILSPYKAAIKSIVNVPSLDPAFLRSFFESQRWMLEAAGIGTDGLSGIVRIKGLAGVYASTFHTWLDDGDPGLAKTMAKLDRRLRRAERTYANLHELRQTFERMASIFSPRRRRTETPSGAAESTAGTGEGI